jgi:hypothetical protein
MTKSKRDIATWTRWLHIYLSMFSFAALLFFAITGITLNHTGWIEGKEKVEQVEGDVNPAWVNTDSSKVNELKVVEFLRNKYAIRSPLSDFVTDETECSVSFKGPGFNADGYIDRSNGHYQLTITRYGLIAIMNDLHKGRDSGTAWSWLIDISAVLMILVSLSGFLMIFFLQKRRFSGLLWTAIGTIVLFLVYYLFV